MGGSGKGGGSSYSYGIIRQGAGAGQIYKPAAASRDALPMVLTGDNGGQTHEDPSFSLENYEDLGLQAPMSVYDIAMDPIGSAVAAYETREDLEQAFNQLDQALNDEFGSLMEESDEDEDESGIGDDAAEMGGGLF